MRRRVLPTYVYCDGAFYMRQSDPRGRYERIAQPPVSLTAVQIGGQMAADPDNHGMFIRVARCVHRVACPRCGSAIGVPCKLTRGYGVDTHNDRRAAMRLDGTTR